jgi:hypothetical protein
MLLRTILKVIIGLGLLVFSLRSFNMAAGNFWAAGGPPTPNPEIYRFRGLVWLSIACFSMILAVFLFFWSRKKKK